MSMKKSKLHFNSIDRLERHEKEERAGAYIASAIVFILALIICFFISGCASPKIINQESLIVQTDIEKKIPCKTVGECIACRLDINGGLSCREMLSQECAGYAAALGNVVEIKSYFDDGTQTTETKFIPKTYLSICDIDSLVAF